MTTLTVTDYLKYAQLQMAAEALYGFNAITDADKLIPGDTLKVSGEARAIEQAWLTDGNEHASFFVASEAEKFANTWEVVSHISNTSTGFSGTLFKCIKDDPAMGAKAGEYVISMRSTEFIDDAARDSRATNELEIKDHGWAFGQISDMETWYQSLRDTGKIPTGSQLTATGYSLGGHLATAFNFMHGNDVGVKLTAVYTYNGAGVGTIGSNGVYPENLTAMITRFSELRAQAESSQGMDSLLQSDLGKNTYATVKAMILANEGFPSKAILDYIQITFEQHPANPELLLLEKALSNALSVTQEALRVTKLTSGTGGKPAPIPLNHIAGTSFDYQIAMLKTSDEFHTEARSIPGGAWSIVMGKKDGKGLLPITQYDIVGTETTTTPTGISSRTKTRPVCHPRENRHGSTAVAGNPHVVIGALAHRSAFGHIGAGLLCSQANHRGSRLSLSTDVRQTIRGYPQDPHSAA